MTSHFSNSLILPESNYFPEKKLRQIEVPFVHIDRIILFKSISWLTLKPITTLNSPDKDGCYSMKLIQLTTENRLCSR
ncbi:unnamed protein product [Heterobilharzia americana]|nr:unnamed protein product [Heterobilharzia americana]